MMKLHVLILSLLLTIMSCDVPGPWEYDVTDIPVYKGIYASGYIIAGEPIQNICFERLYELNEVSSTRFAFYDSARVAISSGVTSVPLQANAQEPNCFFDTTGYMPLAATDYTLNATIYWDSAGVAVATTLSGVAQVPTTFSLKGTGRYEYPVLGPPPNDSIGRLSYLFTLDDEVRDSVLTQYGFDPTVIPFDQIRMMMIMEQLNPGQSDSPSADTTGTSGQGQFPLDLETLTTFVNDNWDSIYSDIVYYDTNRERIVKYNEGDTIDYLYGNQNLSSHYYPTNYTDDVGTILVTHEFTDSAVFAETRFSNMLNLGVNAEDLYYSGTKRRLVTYDNNVLENGDRLFDNLPVLNYWFVGGYNTLYAYGLERFYQSYQVSTIGNEDDSKVNSIYNITGANGFFVGGVVDTIQFYIDVNPFKESFTRDETFEAFCNEGMRWGQEYGGWKGSEDCKTYLAEYCEKEYYYPEACAELMVEENLLEGKVYDDKTALDSLWGLKVDSLKNRRMNIDSTSSEFGELTKEVTTIQMSILDSTILELFNEDGNNRYCVHNNFPPPGCDSLKVEAYDSQKETTIWERLSMYCEENKWDFAIMPQCGPALVVYLNKIKQEGKFSVVLEREAAVYCATSQEEVCNK